jgi:hypothetical protein
VGVGAAIVVSPVSLGALDGASTADRNGNVYHTLHSELWSVWSHLDVQDTVRTESASREDTSTMRKLIGKKLMVEGIGKKGKCIVLSISIHGTLQGRGFTIEEGRKLRDALTAVIKEATRDRKRTARIKPFKGIEPWQRW